MDVDSSKEGDRRDSILLFTFDILSFNFCLYSQISFAINPLSIGLSLSFITLPTPAHFLWS